MSWDTLEWNLRLTAHYEPIFDICFPKGSAELFVTCSVNDIRVWLVSKKQELLRIQVPNLTCHCIDVTESGDCILSGWSDGKIRAFAPESGALLYTINDAHLNGVTAIASFNDLGGGKASVISGGADGRVRLWARQKLVHSVKEHSKQVNSVKLMIDEYGPAEVFSASVDGSVIKWTLKNQELHRTGACQETTIFTGVRPHPDNSQFLTCGSDRKITYWDTAEMKAIRVLDGSEQEINTVDIEETYDGKVFASGGNDRLVRLWDYDDGRLMSIGRGHSGQISRLKISPDGSKCVSVGREGGIFIWNLPQYT
jgi:WD40 repeat protein